MDIGRSSRETTWSVAGIVLALAAMPVLSAVASTDSATLFGRVTAADTGAPLVDVLVGVVDSLGNFVAGTTTAANGTYEIGDLPAGDYHLIARHGDGYVRELHQGIHCLPAGLSPDVACGGLSRGTLVVVEAGAVVEVDFELDRGGSIEGEVAAASGGEPLLGSVTAWNSQGVHASTGSFVLEGSYSLEGLPSGTYYARAEGSLLETGVLVDELYDDRLCPPPGSDVCDPIAGDPIEVTLGDVTGGIDFVLGRLGSISGQVRSAATGELLPAVVVSLYDVTGRPIQSVGTGEPDGEFEFLVRRGTYYLAATGNAYSLADELYEDLPCTLFSCDPLEGTPITVAEGQAIEGIDVELDEAGAIEGTVDDLREDPAASPIVSLWSRHGLWAGSAFPDAAGAYRLDRLAEDSYFVVASPSGPPEQGFSELYEDRLCVGGADPGCDPTEGTPVQVSSGAATSGIDLEVRDPRPFDCEPGPSRLCLNEGRFQVAVGWIDNPALEERARMEPLTADTAYSWFFRPDNVELLVKVLDACQPPFNRFWVFAAGLTNLDVTLRVVDSWTGEQYVHRSQGNVPFPPLLDTAAFATCAAQAPASAPTRRSPAGIVRARAPGAVDAGGGTCVPGPQRLCLQDGRFAIEAVWTTAGGQTGNGHAEPLTADTGTFWFFNPLNLELIVKVLDACQPPFDRFWVFAAGLTNVDVLLRVTDTSSGESWEHRNPQGVPFEPVLDTDAFSTCP